MSNIHTLAEYKDQEDTAREDTPFNKVYQEQESSFVQRSKPIDLLNLVFPHITWKSFIMLVSIVQIVLFIVTVNINPQELLVPSEDLLVKFGANVGSRIKKGEIHRLFLPIFLHANIFHIFFNVFFQLRMGFTLEKNYGVLKIMILYFVTGIYGNLLSASVSRDTVKVGASGSGMGLIGIVSAELALLWHVIRHRERVIFNILFFSLISIFYYFTFNGANIDHVGHLGGFLAGISMGILYNAKLPNKPSWYNVGSIISYIILGLLALIPTILLFTL